MSKVAAYYHIVFCTKHRQMTIPESHCAELYRYIWSETEKMQCRLKRIGGIGNHLHLLVDLNPSIALAEFVKTVKSKSSGWMARNSDFPAFISWAKEYFAVTVSPECTGVVIDYIKNQKLHHGVTTLEDELSRLHVNAGVSWHEDDMTD